MKRLSESCTDVQRLGRFSPPLAESRRFLEMELTGTVLEPERAFCHRLTYMSGLRN